MSGFTYFQVTKENKVIPLKVSDKCPECKETLLIEDAQGNANGTETPVLWCPVCEKVQAIASFTVRVA